MDMPLNQGNYHSPKNSFAGIPKSFYAPKALYRMFNNCFQLNQSFFVDFQAKSLILTVLLIKAVFIS